MTQHGEPTTEGKTKYEWTEEGATKERLWHRWEMTLTYEDGNEKGCSKGFALAKRIEASGPIAREAGYGKGGEAVPVTPVTPYDRPRRISQKSKPLHWTV